MPGMISVSSVYCADAACQSRNQNRCQCRAMGQPMATKQGHEWRGLGVSRS